MSLLEKAKQISAKKGDHLIITDEHIELALSWVKNEVTITQINKVLSKTSTASYSILARALKKHLYKPK